MKILLNAMLMRGAWDAAVETELSAPAVGDVSAFGMKREGVAMVSCETAAQAEKAVRDFYHGAFRMDKMGVRLLLKGATVFENRDSLIDYGPGQLILEIDEGILPAVKNALILARCEGYARMLGNLPSNVLRTADMARYLEAMARDCGLTCRTIGDDALREMGCGGILAVNQATGKGAAMMALENHPEQKSPLALVGKGVMFDAGGVHLKDFSSMDGMKSDMCGAAVVAEVAEYAARAGIETPILAVMPLVENLVSEQAVRSGDVITTLSGQTVEVYFTDAEGRLILCDALTYAQNCGAKTVIDIATLTYGCQSALGNEIGGLFCNDPALLSRVQAASAKTGEKLWNLPLDECYHKAIHWSDVADFANYAPGYGAAASVAACFLEEFIEPGTAWAHIDVVGPSVRKGGCDFECKGARGFGLSTLIHLLQLVIGGNK